MQHKIKNTLVKFSAKFGYQTEKKRVLLFSDDWGGLRVRSKEAQESLKKKGINIDANRFDKYDGLETNDDVELLFEVLSKHRDYRGNPFCMIPVSNVANPDFKKIQESNFKEYYFEKNTDTYQRHEYSDRVFQLIRQGIKEKIFMPQSHAREHVQVQWWLDELKQKDSVARKVFDDEYFSIEKKHLYYNDRSGLNRALNIRNEEDLDNVKKVVSSGLELFEEIFGYKASSICSPAAITPAGVYPILKEKQITWLEQARIENIPNINGKFDKKLRILGRKSKEGLFYLVRNAYFETNVSQNNDGVDRCLKDIENAFKAKQPALISNHRVCFMGRFDVKNRDQGLSALERLLSKILKKWPDVEFVTLEEAFI